MQLRPAEPLDRDQIVSLIAEVYREYGDRLCLENADSDLLDIEANYHAAGGAFIVLDNQGIISGTHAALPLKDRPGVCTFRRLYLAQQYRGETWGERLMNWALDWAIQNNQHRVEFWSDTRFTRAHRFFRRLGFQQDGQIRRMDDGWMEYQEYFFFRDLRDDE